MNARIVRILSKDYTLLLEDGTRVNAVAMGKLRKNESPVVGDLVDAQMLNGTWGIQKIYPRKNCLIRPACANVDQALLIFAITHPAPSYNMLDRFLITMNQKDLPAILCFNKQDLATPEEIRELRETYESCGCRVFFVSVLSPDTLGELREILKGKTTVLTGPSGVGKSTLINTICPGARMETGELSRKIKRGKNTTRHVELLAGDEETYLVDTPGFTSLYLMDMEPEDLRLYYPEFDSYEGKCRFDGCVHMREPGCAVREALEAGQISRIRYKNYSELFEELKGRKPDYSKKSGRKP